MAERTTLYSPTGRPYETADPVEITRLVMGYGYSETPPAEVAVETPESGEPVVFDPSEHNVEQVEAFLRDHPEQRDAIVAAEKAGQNRKSIVGG